ncbi:DNA methyltransferase [Escherichia coli]
MVFSDWRQLPTMTDVFQAGGVLWRGLVVWDKTQASVRHTPAISGIRPSMWSGAATENRQCQRVTITGCDYAACCPVRKTAHAAKPVQLMAELVKPLAPDAHVLDPFMGSGTTAIPVLARGGRFTGIEMTNQYFDIACARIKKRRQKQRRCDVAKRKLSIKEFQRSLQEYIANLRQTIEAECLGFNL